MVKTWRAERPRAIVTAPPTRGDPGTCYSNRRWRRYSAQFLAAYPMCVLCLARGAVNAGANMHHAATQRSLVVDHIAPHRGDSTLFWDQANHETLCRFPCHDVLKSRHEHANRSVAQWWDTLRGMVKEHGSRATIESLAQWVPDHAYAELMRE